MTASSSTCLAAPPLPWAGLLSLAVATFLSISCEMLPTGLLTEMSVGLHASESAVGLLVSVFAFTVVVTSTLLTQVTRRIPRHRLIVGLILVLAISAAFTAVAPTYGWVVASRIVGGLAHGVFWAVGGAYAAHLVPRQQVGRALAVSMSGGTLAFVLGVPLGTALGQAIGWRPTFGVLAALLLIGAVVIARFLPAVPPAPADDDSSDLAGMSTPVGPGALTTDSIRVVTQAEAERARRASRTVTPSLLAVILTCVVTGIMMIGHYSFYTYVSPFLTEVSDIATDHLSVALFAYGLAGGFGLLLVGWFLARRPTLSVPLAIALTAIVVIALTVFEGRGVPSFVAFVVLGVVFGVLPPLLQTRVLQVAPVRIRDLSSAIYTSSFNAGIGGGALIGAIVLAGAGLGALPVFYAAVAAVVFVVVIVTNGVLARRR